MLEALIFDLDGVIVDSEPLHFEADRMTMRDYGMEISDGSLEKYIGVAGPDMWAELIPQYGIPETLERVIERQLAHKDELLAATVLHAVPGIPQLLESAKAAGLKMGIASSSPRSFISAMLENLGLAGYFCAVASGQEVEHGKPAPDVFLKAAELLRADPAHCLVIEDARQGVRAAKAAGMFCIGFANPTSGMQDLSQADEVVDSIDSIDLAKYR